MDKRTAILVAMLIIAAAFTSTRGQQVIPSSGGQAAGGGGTVSYTVGQVFYSAYSGTNGSVAQGAQQPYEISVASGIDENPEISLKYSVYPNPAKDFLILKIEGDTTGKSVFSLFDINGKQLAQKKINASETNIVTGNLSSGTYFLKVTTNGKAEKNFKIIKN
jgi:hypothetical protein